MINRLLILFTRNPVTGRVKSRIAAFAGAEKAVAVFKFLLNRTLIAASEVSPDKALFFSDFIDMNICNDSWKHCSIQEGSDLGERMCNAFEESFLKGYKHIILVGTDISDLTSDIIEKGFSELESSDCVIGPASDGGYYLIGLNSPDKDIFSDISWGTSMVFTQTVNNLRKKKKSFGILKVLQDIDTEEDAMRIPQLRKILIDKDG